MTTYEPNTLPIDTNVPPPAKNRAGLFSATLRVMKVGDSFLAAGGSATFHSAARAIGVRISVRRQPDGRYRVWRVE